MTEKLKRRDFIKRGAASAVVASLGVNRVSLFSQDSAAQPGPNDKIVLGFIGMGRMGQSNLETFLKHPDVEIAAVCDVYSPSLDAALKITKGKAKVLKDFRRLLDMKEVQTTGILCKPSWPVKPGKMCMWKSPFLSIFVKGGAWSKPRGRINEWFRWALSNVRAFIFRRLLSLFGKATSARSAS